MNIDWVCSLLGWPGREKVWMVAGERDESKRLKEMLQRWGLKPHAKRKDAPLRHTRWWKRCHP